MTLKVMDNTREILSHRWKHWVEIDDEKTSPWKALILFRMSSACVSSLEYDKRSFAWAVCKYGKKEGS